MGDRKLNSALIVSFLQTAYHFTGNEIYKEKAFELMDKHGYLENLTRPMSEIGFVEGQPLADEWNHSDDEMYFLCYWILYKYAFNDDLRDKYRLAIQQHWEIERPERNPIWNFVYAMTGAQEYDQEEAVWTLREFPLDLIGWSVSNSHRKDLEFLEPNFRKQRIREVLSPGERPLTLHNSNAFVLDGGEGGRREYPGYIYLLPYWMGRYVGAIGAEGESDAIGNP